jgi:hypothetical protein
MKDSGILVTAPGVMQAAGRSMNFLLLAFRQRNHADDANDDSQHIVN